MSATSHLLKHKAVMTCFLAGFLIRLFPEILAFPNPIGFDTVYYAYALKNGMILTDWTSIFTSSWLLYLVVVPIYSVVRGDPFIILKLVAPVLFGLNVAGIFGFSRKVLGWNVFWSVTAAIFFAVQLAPLRISWDLLRNTLGLALLLSTFPIFQKVSSRKGFFGFIALSVLTVFAHEYAAVALLTVVLGMLVWRLVKKEQDPALKRQLLAIVPAFSVFVIGLILRMYSISSVVSSNVIDAGDYVRGNLGGLFFIVDYLRVRSAVDYYPAYLNLVFSVLVLFTVLYLSYLILIFKGVFKNAFLDLWTVLLVIGAFGCLVFPFFALEYWHRWMFMLAYPFTFYAVNALRKSEPFSDLKSGSKVFRNLRFGYKAMVLATACLGMSYLFTPVFITNWNSSLPSATFTAAYFSTSPTVPYQDVSSVVALMDWLDASESGNSCIVLQHAFFAWGQLYLDESHTIVQFETDLDKAVMVAQQSGFDRVLFVWWNVDIGWYEIRVPDGFTNLHAEGRISVYEYLV